VRVTGWLRDTCDADRFGKVFRISGELFGLFGAAFKTPGL
jgi:hypothetical protein